MTFSAAPASSRPARMGRSGSDDRVAEPAGRDVHRPRRRVHRRHGLAGHVQQRGSGVGAGSGDWPRSRSRSPQGCVASALGTRVGVEPLSGRNCWPQGQLGQSLLLGLTRVGRVLAIRARAPTTDSPSIPPSGHVRPRQAARASPGRAAVDVRVGPASRERRLTALRGPTAGAPLPTGRLASTTAQPRLGTCGAGAAAGCAGHESRRAR
jgi:hypothetical protein